MVLARWAQVLRLNAGLKGVKLTFTRRPPKKNLHDETSDIEIAVAS